MDLNSIPEGTPITLAIWCSGCSAEQATDTIDLEVNGHWVTLNIGPDCLTRLVGEGKIDL